ncbi:MAG: hypothetical protein MUF59_07915 [Candidatus Krumholzibacteria bacterium]|jgi:hypothetical protein|nr:hypothetical protein [Candidatus Krumholzibacteria bacterium]
MRYLTAISFILMILSGTAAAGGAEQSDNGNFSAWAIGRSSELDSEWNRIAGSAPDVSPDIEGALAAGSGATAGRYGKTHMERNGAGNAWKSTISRGGFIHKGMTTQFLPNVTKKRSSPSRGTGTLESPADAKLSGKRRLPFDAMNFSRNVATGLRGAERRHPAMGTRISSSATRGSASSNTLGSSRTRKSR